MRRRPDQTPGKRLTWRRALVGAGAGVVSYALVSISAHALLQRFPLSPNGPDSWKFAAVVIGILAAAVVIVLGFVPGWSRRRAARLAAGMDPYAPPRERHRSPP